MGEYKRANLKNYRTHPGAMQKLTGIELAVPKGITRNGNLDYLMQLPEITVVEGSRYALTLTFDDRAQGKTFRIGGHLPLTVNY